eukprot:TRINITY_DN24880_c0_g1_i3.p1 TRINITY_DN24880_c0_g1~~TRINITY_DN24880_c0_g1_i3.p1  ORF type:complete len:842 (+),score=162.18 TRINITY_DN24880_c0_g1_i3:62-2587(+)
METWALPKAVGSSPSLVSQHQGASLPVRSSIGHLRGKAPGTTLALLGILGISAVSRRRYCTVRKFSIVARRGTATDSRMIALSEVLSTCVDACHKGCAQIRKVQKSRSEGGSLAVSRKDDEDARSALTEADLAAQKAIVTALRAEWPGIRIIGEEDGNDAAAAVDDGGSVEQLRRDLCPLEANLEVPLEAITVFVDPLDGTREFVEGRLENVQSLIGMAVDGRAVAGAIGLPFPAGSEDTDTAVVYGLVGQGVGCFGQRAAPPQNSESQPPVVVTGDSKNAVLKVAKDVALQDGGTSLVIGGVGSKILAIVDQQADIAIMHFGTSLWDTCATEAVLRALGGKVTDLFGSPLVHSPVTASGDFFNSLGVIASNATSLSAHKALCAAMRRDPTALALLKPWNGGSEEALQEHAADVARGLDGAPLQATWLGEKLGGHLSTYSAPEGSTARGMMSDACRLKLAWQGDDAAKQDLPGSVYYKRIVMGDLEHTRAKAKSAPMKLARDVKSYEVEARFLGSSACAQLVSAGVKVARAYFVDLRPCEENPIESRFSMLLQDFSPEDGWHQTGMFGPSEARSALLTLARFHAFFWTGSNFWKGPAAEVSQLEAAIWPAGGYWQPSMQQEEQFSDLAGKWTQHYSALGEEFSSAQELSEVNLPNLGAALQPEARKAASEAHPFDDGASGDANAAMPYRTLIHGDPKAANMFVRNGGGNTEVGMIDFQWCGFGLASTEIAHFMCASVSADCLKNGGDTELLDYYHNTLCEALAEFGVASTAEEAAKSIFPRATLQKQYDVATLDMCRLVFGYQWSRADFKKQALNRNGYNKCLDSALWLTARCNSLLSKLH